MNDDDQEDWRASSLSFSNGNCVEVASGIHLRDSKDRHGPTLTFSAHAWRRFINEIKK